MLNVVTQRRLTDTLMTYQQDRKDCKDLQRLSLMFYVWRYLEVWGRVFLTVVGRGVEMEEKISFAVLLERRNTVYTSSRPEKYKESLQNQWKFKKALQQSYQTNSPTLLKPTVANIQGRW